MRGHVIVRSCMGVVLLAGVLAAADALGQHLQGGVDSIKMTFVPLTEDANALIAEPPKKDRLRSRIAILIAHPEHINMFNDDFLAPNLARRGYRTMMMDYYGKEETYEEFSRPSQQPCAISGASRESIKWCSSATAPAEPSSRSTRTLRKMVRRLARVPSACIPAPVAISIVFPKPTGSCCSTSTSADRYGL